jgi:hypothetical protein
MNKEKAMSLDTTATSKAPKAVKEKKAAGAGGSADRSAEARRRAAAILEVLAGSLKPSEAAALVGVSTPRYYMLEAKAIEGLAAACEPQPLGPGRNAQRELKALRRKYAHLEHECARYQALARAAQRTLGLSHSKPPEPTGGRRHRPTVRALKAAERLKASLPPQGQPGQAPQPAAQGQSG